MNLVLWLQVRPKKIGIIVSKAIVSACHKETLLCFDPTSGTGRSRRVSQSVQICHEEVTT